MRLLLLQPCLEAFGAQSNLERIEEVLLRARDRNPEIELVLLPEHFTSQSSVAAYTDFLLRLAEKAGCPIVGGSHHRSDGERRINYGCAVDAGGNVIGEYSKLRPYFNEMKHISPGEAFGEFAVAGWHILVLICADFWYSDLILRARRQPDIILVPALSVSRKKEPDYSRALWRHLAVARAYEFGAYVGISDWHADSELPKYRTCGAAGLADPHELDPKSFFRPVGEEEYALFSLDQEALHNFREDRRMRGFFWKTEE